MNQFDRKLFYKEFPFLHTLKHQPEYCEDIIVRRASPDMLHRTPGQCKIGGPNVDIDEGDEVFLFTQGGQMLGQVRASYELREQGRDAALPKPGETVLEAIYRLEVIEPLHYIVWVAYGYRIIHHHSEPEWKVTIYKPAKHLCLAELVAKAELKSMAKISAQIDF